MTKTEFLEYVDEKMNALARLAAEQNEFVVQAKTPHQRQDWFDVKYARARNHLWSGNETQLKDAVKEMVDWPAGLQTQTLEHLRHFRAKSGAFLQTEITHLPLITVFATMLGVDEETLRRMVEVE
jgi:hypothetical protein